MANSDVIKVGERVEGNLTTDSRFEGMGGWAAWPPRTVASVLLIGLLTACAADQASTSPPSASPSPSHTTTMTPEPTLAASPTPTAGPRQVTSENFGVPFSLTAPEGWTRQFDDPTYFAIFEPRGGQDVPVVGIDLGIVPNVYADPCRRDAGYLDPTLGASVDDLVAYLLGSEMLNASRVGNATVGGYEGQVIDEAFVASDACPELLMWDGGSGNVFEEERKRYVVIDVGGQRVVAVMVASEPEFEAVLPEALEVLGTVTFAP